MVKTVTGGVEAPQTNEMPETNVVVEMAKSRVEMLQQHVENLDEIALELREAGVVDVPAMPEGVHKAVEKVKKGVDALDRAAKFAQMNKGAEAAKEAKGAAKELKEAITNISKAEGKAKLGFVKKLALALLKVATSLSKLCEFLANLTLEVMGEEDKSTVAQIAKSVRAISKPINDFVKAYEERAKTKAAEAAAAKVVDEVEQIADEVEVMVDEVVGEEVLVE